MRNGAWTLLAAVGALVGPALAQPAASVRVAPGVVGGLKIGMTVAQARATLKSFSFDKGVYSDHKGAMLPVKRGKTIAMWLLAGKYDNGELMTDTSRIDIVQVLDPAFSTADGVRPGMRVADAEKKLGRVKLVEASESDGAEFATFTRQRAGLKYAVKLPGGGEVGRYPQPVGEYRKASTYRPTAVIDMLVVFAAPTPAPAPK